MKALIARYLVQVTKGCGHPVCKTKYCKSNMGTSLRCCSCVCLIRVCRSVYVPLDDQGRADAVCRTDAQTPRGRAVPARQPARSCCNCELERSTCVQPCILFSSDSDNSDSTSRDSGVSTSNNGSSRACS